MPSSKEVRARQNRQRERVAAARAERMRRLLRRRRVGGTAAVLVLVVVVLLGFTLGGAHNNSTTAPPTTAAPATTTPTTVAALASVKGKPCVGLKDPIPKGSPPFLLGPGPAPTKLATQDLTVGTGAVVAKNTKVTVNYTGIACSNGKIFESSFTDGQPFDADLGGGVIAGWIQGIPGMKIGGVRLLTIPSALAYGSSGSPPKIAPDESLYFVISAVKLG